MSTSSTTATTSSGNVHKVFVWVFVVIIVMAFLTLIAPTIRKATREESAPQQRTQTQYQPPVWRDQEIVLTTSWSTEVRPLGKKISWSTYPETTIQVRLDGDDSDIVTQGPGKNPRIRNAKRLEFRSVSPTTLTVYLDE